MGSLITRHGYALAASVRMLRQQGGTAFFTLVMLALALAVPLALALLTLEVRGASASLPAASAVAVYLKPGISEQQAQQLAATARARRDVAAVTLITATQALQDLRTHSGLAAALDALADNPLPNALEIVPASSASMIAELEGLRSALAAWPETDAVQVDRDWARRMDATADLIHQLLRVTALLLGLAVIAVVANTIRLEIHGQRTAIETAQLVGASRAFVRRPFLYLGALYAVVAALLACGVVAVAGRALADPVGAVASAYGTRIALRWPGPRELGILFGAAWVLGWLGAATAAAQQVADLDARP